MYFNNDGINKEKHNKTITHSKKVTNFTIPKHCQKSINSVSSLLIKEPICQDSTEIQSCSLNSRPMYQDVKIENCFSSKIKQPQEIVKPPKSKTQEIVKPPKSKTQEIVKPPKSKISKDKPTVVTKIPSVQVKKDETPPKKSVEMLHTCGKAILVESPMFRRKSLWITPKPSSVYKEHYNSIPKIMNIKY
ncbi:unnamed protein product [Macrosiphum euphorbiae]|uniref:Uncharacterized protein n=1 Tax=Macrosiphum euphorbiae TaxID=13131 RepID=A0AAV0WV19_9HEMI|nr:unnamed protein product [Macrosiphum euphorbiae]